MRHRLRQKYGRYGHSRSMSFGVVPPYKEFLVHIRGVDPDEGRPYLASGQLYPIEAHNNTMTEKVLYKARIEPTGGGGYGRDKYDLTEKQLYSLIKRLVRISETARDDEMREEAMSLASGIMQTLGYEWI